MSLTEIMTLLALEVSGKKSQDTYHAYRIVERPNGVWQRLYFNDDEWLAVETAICNLLPWLPNEDIDDMISVFLIYTGRAFWAGATTERRTGTKRKFAEPILDMQFNCLFPSN
jgi:hypothetical protein